MEGSDIPPPPPPDLPANDNTQSSAVEAAESEPPSDDGQSSDNAAAGEAAGDDPSPSHFAEAGDPANDNVSARRVANDNTHLSAGEAAESEPPSDGGPSSDNAAAGEASGDRATPPASTDEKPAGDQGDDGEDVDDENDSEDGKDKSNEQGDKDRIGEVAVAAAENDPPTEGIGMSDGGDVAIAAHAAATDSGGQAAHELGSAIATAALIQHEIGEIIEGTPTSEHSATYSAEATWGGVGPAAPVTSLDSAGGDAPTDQALTSNQIHAKVDQLVVAWQDVAAWSSAVSKGDETFHELSADQADALQGQAQDIAKELEKWNSEQQHQQTFAHVEHAPSGHAHGEAVHAAGGAVDPGIAAAVTLAATIEVATQVIDVFNSLWAGTAEDK